MYWKLTNRPTDQPLVHHSDARGDSKGGGNGGQYGDEDVQDFAPKLFVFHGLFSFLVVSLDDAFSPQRTRSFTEFSS